MALTSGGGAQAAQLYGPYGGTRYSSGTMPGSYGFTGQRADAQTGLDYYGARYYDPAAGQFISADSVLPGGGYNPWGLSRYAYVTGNPETHIDADGHCWPLCTILIGAAVGAVMGGGGDIVGDLVTGHAIDWSQVGKDAAVGALTGAISGLAGPEAGLATHAAIDAAASAGGQVLNNALNHKPLGDGVLAAAAIGGASSLGLGLLAKAGGAALAKLAGRAGESVEAAASHETGAVCGLSFAANTLVSTPKGKQAIASLKVGDQVTAYDPKTDKATTQTVQQTFINHDTGLLDVTLRVVQAATSSSPTTAPALDAAHKQRLVALARHGSHAPSATTSSASSTTDTAASTSVGAQPGDETIHTTANHPWLSADHGWIVAGKLTLGEPVHRVDGSVAIVVALTSVHGAAPMWDLTISDVHDFAVGNGAYVVHNCGRQVEYDSGGLSSKVSKFRGAQRTLGGRTRGNYAAALLEDDSVIYGKSGGGLHAEEDLFKQADRKGLAIKSLYSEREPCSTGHMCSAQLAKRGIKDVSWTWKWNGEDHASVTSRMGTFFRERFATRRL